MFSFLIGALGGAAISGGYVLLRTPRTGQENQQFVKDFVNTTKNNVEDVQTKAGNVQFAVNQLKTEVAKIQVNLVPEVMEIVEGFQTEAQVYTRRINDGVADINNEVKAMNMRINMKNESVTMDQTDNN